VIIFGTRVRLKVLQALVFFCPRCGGDRQGERLLARRWFTLFFLPVIPMDRVGEVVRCSTCRATFDPSVADQPTSADLSVVLSNAVRVLAAMIVRTGDGADARLRAAAVDVVAKVDPAYDDAHLAGDVDAVDPTLADRYVEPLAATMAVPGKERLVADLVRIALTDGTITPDQRRVIDATGRGLGLTPAHVTGIVSSVASAGSPPPPPDAPGADLGGPDPGAAGPT